MGVIIDLNEYKKAKEEMIRFADCFYAEDGDIDNCFMDFNSFTADEYIRLCRGCSIMSTEDDDFIDEEDLFLSYLDDPETDIPF